MLWKYEELSMQRPNNKINCVCVCVCVCARTYVCVYVKGTKR